MDEILSLLKNKHKQIDNIMTFTKELEKVAESNDPEALGAVIAMRQEAMDKVDKVNADIRESLAGLDQESRDKVLRLLAPECEPEELDGRLETDVFNMNQMITRLLQKVVDMDKIVSKKINTGRYNI